MGKLIKPGRYAVQVDGHTYQGFKDAQGKVHPGESLHGLFPGVYQDAIEVEAADEAEARKVAFAALGITHTDRRVRVNTVEAPVYEAEAPVPVAFDERISAAGPAPKRTGRRK